MDFGDRITFLIGASDLPHYARGIIHGVLRAKRQNREEEISSNSILFINRMWENRIGDSK
ncbi:MAG: hypothetical protein HQK53_20055 [Oligoflexia bacterium]|nr:hypothetical protein [Oligoflexia bacterium]